MMRNLGLSLLLLAQTTHAIYDDGHFDRVTKIADVAHLKSFVQGEFDADRSVLVRWIASVG